MYLELKGHGSFVGSSEFSVLNVTTFQDRRRHSWSLCVFKYAQLKHCHVFQIVFAVFIDNQNFLLFNFNQQ